MTFSPFRPETTQHRPSVLFGERVIADRLPGPVEVGEGLVEVAGLLPDRDSLSRRPGVSWVFGICVIHSMGPERLARHKTKLS